MSDVCCGFDAAYAAIAAFVLTQRAQPQHPSDRMFCSRLFETKEPRAPESIRSRGCGSLLWLVILVYFPSHVSWPNLWIGRELDRKRMEGEWETSERKEDDKKVKILVKSDDIAYIEVSFTCCIIN